ANALKTAMDPEALQKMVSSGTTSVAAYEAYLEGLALEGRTGESGAIENWDKALAAYDRAVALDDQFALAHWGRALYWESQLSVTDIGSELSPLSREEKLENYLDAIDAAIGNEENETLALKFMGNKARNELRYADSRRYYESYIEAYPNDIEGLQQLIGTIAYARDLEGARPHMQRILSVSLDDPLLLNAVINDVLFVGLVDDAVSLARDLVQRFPQHAFLLYQSHRILLWAGHTEEAAALADILRGSEFPAENIKLVLLRQACAEGDQTAAQQYYEEVVAIQRPDPSLDWLGLHIMGKPEAAHRILVEADMDKYALASFLNYPFFDHTYFPELAAILEQQGIVRPFIESPPYACKSD
ncbi:MAG: hypothetical protein IIB74_12420, partial [Proteobacteria bacterium]|nr:hypothetical protein [Pseudomonadota bacterium]